MGTYSRDPFRQFMVDKPYSEHIYYVETQLEKSNYKTNKPYNILIVYEIDANNTNKHMRGHYYFHY